MELERLKKRNENCVIGRGLLEKLRSNEETFVEDQRAELTDTVRESSVVFSAAESTTELRIDTEIGLAISEIHVKRVQRIATSFESVTLQDFVACIAQKLLSSHERQASSTTRVHKNTQVGKDGAWSNLGNQHVHTIASASRFNSLLGPISNEPIQREGRHRVKRRMRNTHGVGKLDTIVIDVDTDDKGLQREEGEMEKRIQYLTITLRKHQRVALPQFVTDPESYINTVENLFHLSFLIRQGAAEIRIEDDASILLYKELKRNESIDPSDYTFKQSVIRLDYETWEEMALKYPRRILDPWIPSKNYLKQIGMTLEELNEMCAPLTPNSKAVVLRTLASRPVAEKRSHNDQTVVSSSKRQRGPQPSQHQHIDLDSDSE